MDSSLECTYERPEHISAIVWQAVEPKLLPYGHPIKSKLDKIFKKNGVLHDVTTLDAAGFFLLPVNNPAHTLVAKHPKIKGYVFKLFTDIQVERNEWEYWLQRIQGAELIAEAIQKNDLGGYFKVPKKWIYLIPSNIEPEEKTFLLVAEDMKIVDHKKNRSLWKNQVTTDLLDALYFLFESVGLLDSVYIDNIPFSKDKKIAFIDTEHTLKWPVPYHKLNGRLSPEMSSYWIQLTRQNGN